MPPSQTIDSRTFGTNCTSNSSYETNWTSFLSINNYSLQHQSSNDAYHSQRPYETTTSPHSYVN